MTVSNAAVSQVSQLFDWQRVEDFAVESDEGYRIVALLICDCWSYSAFGPEEKIIQKDGGLFFRDLEYKESYLAGERVPPPYDYHTKKARYFIGGFPQKKYSSVDAALLAAKAACELDFENNK